MEKSLQLFAILLISFIQIQSIYSIDNLYTSNRNNIYYMDNELKYTWFNALAKCNSMNMSLVTIDTKEKSDEITDLMKNTFAKVNPLWIGGVAIGSDHHYVWISTGRKFTFTNWAAGEPSYSSETELCLLNGWSDKMLWNDHQCHKNYGVMCEYGKDYNRVQEMKTKLQDELDKEQNLQTELDKKQLMLQLLLDYRTSRGNNDEGRNTRHDLHVKVN
ncbi:ladderlectin-like [Calliphora vicina]|uniref:ladderlectin-like n=1 Tax=Calliphora vicina TaxID=7373 RepID=UPI00325C1129